MGTKINYTEDFFKSINILTGISMTKLRNYAKDNSLFNILEHPMVIEPNDRQLSKIGMLNEFIATYNILKIEEKSDRMTFSSSKIAGTFFLSLLGGMKDRERVIVAFLDNSNSIIEVKTVSEGSTSEAMVYPKEILKMAMLNDCKNIIMAHNHPGNSLQASSNDIALTQRMVDIFTPLDIKIMDHIIVGGYKYTSMAEEGYLPNKVLDKANYSLFVLEENLTNEDVRCYEIDNYQLGAKNESEELEL